MQLIQTTKDLEKFLLAKEGKRTALVPTLGNIHPGHLSLVDLAKRNAELVVVSIFVNPLQFSANEDFSAYPRTIKNDIDLLSKKNIDYLFIPKQNLINKKIFPLLEKIRIEKIRNKNLEDFHLSNNDIFNLQVPDKLSKVLCGKSRPHFFHGVASIVFRLFQTLKPNKAVFGEKDYQQFLVVKSMVKDLCLPVEIILGKTVREVSGLALSSRNSYLSREEKELAKFIYASLKLVRSKLKTGSSFDLLKKEMTPAFKKKKITLEYFELLDQRNLAPILETRVAHLSSARVFFAGHLGKARLIDNLKI